jgi:hypothetical protein
MVISGADTVSLSKDGKEIGTAADTVVEGNGIALGGDEALAAGLGGTPPEGRGAAGDSFEANRVKDVTHPAVLFVRHVLRVPSADTHIPDGSLHKTPV